MVRDRWYVILAVRELPAKGPLGVTRLGKRLVLWRDRAGALQCVGDVCPHRGAALSAGRVVDDCVECPFHGFQFDGTGACTVLPAHGTGPRPIPANMRSPRHVVREHQGFVYLWTGPSEPGTLPWFDELPWFEELNASFEWDGFTDDWATHYTRAIENQLDFTHLPFAHRTTIGRAVPGRLEVLTEVDGDRMRITYDPATYDAKGFFVKFHLPNLWLNRLAPGIFALMAFAPVDEANTRIYVRFYQRKMAVPGAAWAVAWVGNLFNRYILGQDKRIVLTQRPVRTDLGMVERLVPSDRPILEFRRWRHHLLEAPEAEE